MTTVETVLQATPASRPVPRPTVAMAVLVLGLVLCAAGYAAVALLLLRSALALLG